MACNFAGASRWLLAILALAKCCTSVSPVQKVVSLLRDLEAKVIRDGEAEQKSFEAYVDWCNNGAKDKEYEIKTAKSDIEDLTATIGKAESDIGTTTSKIEDLTGSISSNDGDLKAATGIRDNEHSEFAITEKELVESVDTLERAINVLQRKLHGSQLLQEHVDRNDVEKLIHTLSTIIDAAALSLNDKQRLVGLVQNSEEGNEDDEEIGAPAPGAYKAKSESIIDVLEDLKQKAESQLDESRRNEANSRHNFELLKQSLDDQIKVDTKELSDAKNMKHDATETKAVAGGDLVVTKKDMAEAETVLKNMKGNCMARSTDHESSVASRAEELKAIAAATKAITEMTGGAANIAYEEPSFLQLDGSADGATSGSNHLRTRLDLANFEVVNLVRKLAREQKSAALSQLAMRIEAALHAGAGTGEDPFVKVKAMISDMIARLSREAGEEAQHKQYCDQEMKETKKKTSELGYDIDKLSSKIDKATAESADLKDEVSNLQREISKIVQVQGEADKLRQAEHKEYLTSKTDIEQGLEGIRMALKILRDYYASESALVQQPVDPEVHSKSAGAAGGVIGMLEVVEADFGKSLASTEVEEDTAATAYQRLVLENKVAKASKESSVKFKAKEAAGNDKAVTEFNSDRDSAQTELDAVLKATVTLRGMCVQKPESWEERQGRREAEVAGLREALQILEGEAVLLQRQGSKAHGGLLRGTALLHIPSH